MDLSLQIHELSQFLDDDKKRLVLEIIKNFLPYDDEEETDEERYYIDLAQEEYARGETISHNDRNWK